MVTSFKDGQGSLKMDSFIQRLFIEHLLSTRHCPRHWALTKADKTPCPGGEDILTREIQTGNK